MSEIRTIAILDKIVEYEHEFYLCEDSGTQWTTTEIDEGNLNRIKEGGRYEYTILQENR